MFKNADGIDEYLYDKYFKYHPIINGTFIEICNTHDIEHGISNFFFEHLDWNGIQIICHPLNYDVIFRSNRQNSETKQLNVDESNLSNIVSLPDFDHVDLICSNQNPVDFRIENLNLTNVFLVVGCKIDKITKESDFVLKETFKKNEIWMNRNYFFGTFHKKIIGNFLQNQEYTYNHCELIIKKHVTPYVMEIKNYIFDKKSDSVIDLYVHPSFLNVMVYKTYAETVKGVNFGTSESIYIDKPCIFLYITSNNSAHSIGELIRGLSYYYHKQFKQCKILIPKFITEILPYIYQFVMLFIEKKDVIMIDSNVTYSISELHIVQNIWILLNEFIIKPTKNDEHVITYENLEHVFSKNNIGNIKFVEEKVNMISKIYWNLPKFDKIVFIKTKTDSKYCQTLTRCCTIDDTAKKLLSENGFKFINISDFGHIVGLIYTLHNARIVITSYGGALCTNRLFFHPRSTIFVICNLAYAYEWRNENHIITSHLCKVDKMHFIKKNNDAIEIDDVKFILQNYRNMSI